jgi:hypothetical protein
MARLVRHRGNNTPPHALAQLPTRLREPLLNYVYRGILPTNQPWLVLALEGQLAMAVKLYAEHFPAARHSLSAAIAAVEDLSDICLGHPVYVARWCAWGGLDGLQMIT